MIHYFLRCSFVIALMVPRLHAERVALVAGGGDQVSGPAAHCRLHAPFAVDFDRAGNMYIAEMAGGERVLKVDHQGMLTVIAGTGVKGDSGDGGPAATAQFGNVYSVAFDAKRENLYLADLDNRRIRAVNLKTGLVT